MRMKHFIVEGYCEESSDKSLCNGTFQFSMQCFSCPQFRYTDAPNEIALSSNNGIVEQLEDFIGFGGEMEPENIEEREKYVALWRKICREKIEEAYSVYQDTVRKRNA